MMEGDEALARRNTRAALAEIPLRLGLLRVSPPRMLEPLAPLNLNTTPGTPLTPRHAFTPNGFQDNNTPAGASSAFLSPTPSPDELVIQQRGRRRIPVTWSPDIDYKKMSPFQSNNRTPPKCNGMSPLKNGIVLRSTPRKRLLMIDPDKTGSTPEKTELNIVTTPQKLRNHSPNKMSPVSKKLKVEKKVSPSDDSAPLDVMLKGLSHDQLIDIIKGIVQKNPELEYEVKKDLPLPDLRPLEENLIYLKRNIYKSLPTSRLTSKTDSPSYSRAATHVLAFKKQLIEQGRTLADSQQWQSVLEYFSMAWCYVKATPLWDNHPHNTVRRQCFKFLVALCMTTLKRGQFEKMILLDLQEKLELMISDSDDVQSCLKFLEVHLKSI